MKIGLLSDTHGYLDPLVYEYFEHVDEIWHAGDIGPIALMDELATFKKVRAVYGNIDDHQVRITYPEHLRWNCHGLDVWMTHIGGRPGNYATPIRKELKENPPGLFICGHSHICMVKMDTSKKFLYMNPGAAGKHGFHKVRTMLRFEIIKGKLQNLELIELGNRTAG
ncbi:MAG: metallophosphoesterase family protein [Flavobacteriales bacterium]